MTSVNIAVLLGNMRSKRKISVTTNLDTATSEQKEQLMENVVTAYQYLYKSVVERRIRDLIKVKV